MSRIKNIRYVRPEDSPIIPPQELYDSYEPPMIIDKKTDTIRVMKAKEMTRVQYRYYSWIMNYWIEHGRIGPMPNGKYPDDDY